MITCIFPPSWKAITVELEMAEAGTQADPVKLKPDFSAVCRVSRIYGNWETVGGKQAGSRQERGAAGDSIEHARTGFRRASEGARAGVITYAALSWLVPLHWLPSSQPYGPAWVLARQT